MANYKTVYQCRECGATSYQQVIDRAQDGSLKATGQYKCTGCRNVFASIRAWWEPRRKHDFQGSKFSNSAMANTAGAGGSLSA
jgi:DNA-directed RNA polymerase subunit RPC12/RpoP